MSGKNRAYEFRQRMKLAETLDNEKMDAHLEYVRALRVYGKRYPFSGMFYLLVDLLFHRYLWEGTDRWTEAETERRRLFRRQEFDRRHPYLAVMRHWWVDKGIRWLVALVAVWLLIYILARLGDRGGLERGFVGWR